MKIKDYLGFIKIGFLFLFVVAVFWYVSVYSRSVLSQSSFSVSGEGKVVAVPDIAELSFGILTEGGKNLADLQKQNSERANRVIAFLKEQGIEEKDIKTQFYDISPRYQYFSCPAPLSFESRPCPPSEIIGYSINQSILVKIRNLSKAGDIVAGVVDKGANTVSGLSFTVDDRTALENKARSEAISQARQKAKSIAKAGGFRLGKLISVQEGFLFPSPIVFKESRVGGGPSIEPGSQEIVVTVNLIYEIR